VIIASMSTFHFRVRPGLEFIQQLALESDERAGTLLAVANK
jgi:hypothetical protein